MNPPRGISQRLKAFDKDLHLRWNPAREKWEVWCRPNGRPDYYVITVRNDDGSYRPPDNRIFLPCPEFLQEYGRQDRFDGYGADEGSHQRHPHGEGGRRKHLALQPLEEEHGHEDEEDYQVGGE